MPEEVSVEDPTSLDDAVMLVPAPPVPVFPSRDVVTTADAAPPIPLCAMAAVAASIFWGLDDFDDPTSLEAVLVLAPPELELEVFALLPPEVLLPRVPVPVVPPLASSSLFAPASELDGECPSSLSKLNPKELLPRLNLELSELSPELSPLLLLLLLPPPGLDVLFMFLGLLLSVFPLGLPDASFGGPLVTILSLVSFFVCYMYVCVLM